MNLQFVSRLMTLLFLWLIKNLVQGWVSRPAENPIANLELVGLVLAQDKLLQLQLGGGKERGIINTWADWEGKQILSVNLKGNHVSRLFSALNFTCCALSLWEMVEWSYKKRWYNGYRSASDLGKTSNPKFWITCGAWSHRTTIKYAIYYWSVIKLNWMRSFFFSKAQKNCVIIY